MPSQNRNLSDARVLATSESAQRQGKVQGALISISNSRTCSSETSCPRSGPFCSLRLIFSLASMFWAPFEQAIGWLIIVVGAKVILLEVSRKFVAADDTEKNFRMWFRRLLIAEGISGMAWSGFALVGVRGHGVAGHEYIFSSHVFLFASLIVVLAIRMTFVSTVIPIFLIGTVPMDDRCRRPSLCPGGFLLLLARGDGRGRAHLFHLPGAGHSGNGRLDAGISRAEGPADCGTGRVDIHFGRGAAACGSRKTRPNRVFLPP